MNNLDKSSSPYLQQHATNPVDWVEWGEPAFQLARETDKAIFLSIGYSTCHWCHVMAHESFEDNELAEQLNKDYVCIKLDREQRPDLDALYMKVCQMLTGSGGWPLTIIMTPDKRPFFAGTYFPKDTTVHRVGLRDILDNISDLWAHDRSRLFSNANQILLNLVEQNTLRVASPIDDKTRDAALQGLSENFDPIHGGFGDAPKFPTPHTLLFLMSAFESTQEERLMSMVSMTLTEMRLGGVFDHIGFGFHRYATDKKWLLPHFEKMLYDQALLIWAYAKAYSLSKNPLFKQSVHETVTYLKQDLKGPNSLYFAAENADSEGREGAFYVWHKAELESLCDKENFQKLEDVSLITEKGNFVDESTKLITHENIIHVKKESDLPFIDTLRGCLMEARSKRIRPSRDEKYLTDWNALLALAMIEAAGHLDDDTLLSEGLSILNVLEKTVVSDAAIYHWVSDTNDSKPQLLFDAATIALAYVAAFKQSCKTEYLLRAEAINQIIIKKFRDEKGCFLMSFEKEDLIVNQIESYDGAIPSGNAMVYYLLQSLSKLSPQSDYKDLAEQLKVNFSESIKQYPMGYTFWLFAEEEAKKNEELKCDTGIK
jgi:uncharacterized protein